MLFSDSVAVAREENKEAVRNTRNIKDSIYQRIAHHVFKNDSKEDMRHALEVVLLGHTWSHQHPH